MWRIGRARFTELRPSAGAAIARENTACLLGRDRLPRRRHRCRHRRLHHRRRRRHSVASVRVTPIALSPSGESIRALQRFSHRCSAVCDSVRGVRLQADQHGPAKAGTTKAGHHVLQTYQTALGASGGACPYRRYSAGTTNMFKSVDVVRPHRMTMAMGV